MEKTSWDNCQSLVERLLEDLLHLRLEVCQGLDLNIACQRHNLVLDFVSQRLQLFLDFGNVGLQLVLELLSLSLDIVKADLGARKVSPVTGNAEAEECQTRPHRDILKYITESLSKRLSTAGLSQEENYNCRNIRIRICP